MEKASDDTMRQFNMGKGILFIFIIIFIIIIIVVIVHGKNRRY